MMDIIDELHISNKISICTSILALLNVDVDGCNDDLGALYRMKEISFLEASLIIVKSKKFFE